MQQGNGLTFPGPACPLSVSISINNFLIVVVIVIKNEWTLIARFSNVDSKHWMANGSFWYDRVTPYGDVNSALENFDMISGAFWELKGREIKITRSDDSSHTALLQTTSNCLQGGLVCRYTLVYR